jgi:predicted enzyme related to lactoylglutathione lyase
VITRASVGSVHVSDQDKVLEFYTRVLSFECDDIHVTHKELRGRGVEFSEEPTEQPWGMLARFKDPDGNELGLYSGR